jgi:hypothetical protein
MGQVRDIVKLADNSPNVADDIKETLVLLMNLAKAKGNAYDEIIMQDLMAGKMGDTLTIAITKVIYHKTEWRALTKNGTSKIIDNVKKSMKDLFSGDGNILNGIAGIIDTALTAIIGAGEGQESEVRSYSVVTEYPAIVRYDFAFWGRNISAQSIKEHMENVFTCVAYKSSVDVSKLAFNDFLALYGPVLKTAFGDDQEKIKQMIKEAREVYALFGGKALAVDAEERRPISADMSVIQHPHIKIPLVITSKPATQGDF